MASTSGTAGRDGSARWARKGWSVRKRAGLRGTPVRDTRARFTVPRVLNDAGGGFASGQINSLVRCEKSPISVLFEGRGFQGRSFSEEGAKLP